MKNKKRILFVNTYYLAFLDEFYKQNINIQKLNYEHLKQKLMAQLFGSSNFYSSSLNKNNWNANELIINDWNLQSKWASEHKIKIQKEENSFLRFIPESLKNILNLQKWVKKILFEQIKYYKPDVLYICNLSILNKTDMDELKKHVKLIVGQIASPISIYISTLKQYDLLISSLPNYVKDFQKNGIKSEYLAWCVDKSIFNKVRTNQRKYNVVYIGGLTPHHKKGNKLLEKILQDVNVDVWGYAVNLLPPNSIIKKHYHGTCWGIEMYKTFAASKIVINRHIDVANNYANNMRMFEATAMGALLMTDNNRGLDNFFVDGKEVVTYNSPDDLVQKIKYYLENEKERNKIAQSGQKKTLKYHNYEIRMKELDKILRKYL